MGRRPKDLTRLYDEAEENQTCLVAFTRGERQLLARHVKGDGLVCPLPGLYVRGNVWDGLNPNDRALWAINGLAALHPEWIFCCTSAALVHKLRVSYECSGEVHVVTKHQKDRIDGRDVPTETLASHPLAVSFEQISGDRIDNLEVTKVDGIRVTSPLETISECLCRLNFSTGLVVADSYLATFHTTAIELCKRIGNGHMCRRGLATARETALHADARAESGGESFARARIIANGYETPDLQAVFVDPTDGHIMRADFIWWDTATGTIIGEFDGFAKYREPEMTKGLDVEDLLIKQNMRDNRLGLFCDRIFHFGWNEARSDYQLCRILDAYQVPWKR